MSLKVQRAREWLAKRSRKPKKAYPAATVALYGPTDKLATKLAAALIPGQDEEPEALERWVRDDVDVRHDDQVTLELVTWMKAQGVQQVVITDRIMGCPHEEGIDYPEGAVCPACPFWANRDRFTGEPIDEAEHDAVENVDDPDDVELIYSRHCQSYLHEGVTLAVQIYKVQGTEDGWLLEVVNEGGTSIVWSDLFDSDDEAYAEFERTLHEEGLEAFTSS